MMQCVNALSLPPRGVSIGPGVSEGVSDAVTTRNCCCKHLPLVGEVKINDAYLPRFPPDKYLSGEAGSVGEIRTRCS